MPRLLSSKFVTNNSNKTRHVMKPLSFESRRNSCLRGCLSARLFPNSECHFPAPSSKEGCRKPMLGSLGCLHDCVGGQLRGDKECPFSGVTPYPLPSPSLISRTVSVGVKHHVYFTCVSKSGRVWRKVPESDARSVEQILSCSVLSPFLTGRMFVRPNILRTVRRTMFRLSIELLVRRKWFGQSKLYFLRKWLVMRCKLWPELCVRPVTDSMIQNIG